IPLVLVLLGLILRATSIEYRGKGDTDRWRSNWTLAMSLGSFVAAFGVGAALAITTTGLPLNANGDRVGGAFAWLTWEGDVEGREERRVPHREGGEGRAARREQPHLVAVPDGSDGVEEHPAFLFAPRQQVHVHAHAEIEALEEEVSGPEHGDENKPDCWKQVHRYPSVPPHLLCGAPETCSGRSEERRVGKESRS